MLCAVIMSWLLLTLWVEQGAAEKSGKISVGEVLLAVDDVTGKACSVSRQVLKPGTARTLHALLCVRAHAFW